jgi:hypothetical protein
MDLLLAMAIGSLMDYHLEVVIISVSGQPIQIIGPLFDFCIQDVPYCSGK